MRLRPACCVLHAAGRRLAGGSEVVGVWWLAAVVVTEVTQAPRDCGKCTAVL